MKYQSSPGVDFFFSPSLLLSFFLSVNQSQGAGKKETFRLQYFNPSTNTVWTQESKAFVWIIDIVELICVLLYWQDQIRSQAMCFFLNMINSYKYQNEVKEVIIRTLYIINSPVQFRYINKDSSCRFNFHYSCMK